MARTLVGAASRARDDVRTWNGSSTALSANAHPGHVAMTAIYAWLLKMTGGDETSATVVAVSIALIGAVVLGVGLYFAMGNILMLLPSLKERCPRCRRRSLIVVWCDENDEEGAEYVFGRCASCAARFKQRSYDAWEDASDPKFDLMFNGVNAEQRADPLWDGDLDA
jgi:hypothetical protein